MLSPASNRRSRSAPRPEHFDPALRFECWTVTQAAQIVEHGAELQAGYDREARPRSRLADRPGRTGERKLRRLGLDHSVRRTVSMAAMVAALLLALVASKSPSMQAVDVPALKAKS